MNLPAGAILNAFGIIVGGLLGLLLKKDVPLLDQRVINKILGILTVVVGLKLTWSSLGGGFLSVLKQMLIMVLGMSIGKALGKLFRLQAASNAAGRYASSKMADPKKGADGFNVAAILFCIAPLSFFGAVQEGLHNYPYALIIKGVMDGMAAFTFVRIFGPGTLGSAMPVLAFIGALTLAVRTFEPFLRQHSLIDPILATSGLLVFCVAMVILELKRFELADYIPSFAMVPTIAYFWSW